MSPSCALTFILGSVVASRLGIAIDDVDIQHGDTGVVKQGIGTFGSRSQAVGGTALHMAGTKAKASSTGA